MEEKIRTLHPQGKRGVNIAKKKYVIIRQAILAALARGELTHTQLDKTVNQKLQGKFAGSISWYLESVKLDLEARGVIQRIGKTKPQLYKLVGN